MTWVLHANAFVKHSNVFIHTCTPIAGAYADLDAAAMGIIFTLVVLVLLITLITTGYYFIRKNATTKKGAPTVLS